MLNSMSVVWRVLTFADVKWRMCGYLKQKKVWLPETEESPASTGKNGEGVLRNLVNKIVKGVLWNL